MTIGPESEAAACIISISRKQIDWSFPGISDETRSLSLSRPELGSLNSIKRFSPHLNFLGERSHSNLLQSWTFRMKGFQNDNHQIKTPGIDGIAGSCLESCWEGLFLCTDCVLGNGSVWSSLKALGINVFVFLKDSRYGWLQLISNSIQQICESEITGLLKFEELFIWNTFSVLIWFVTICIADLDQSLQRSR